MWRYIALLLVGAAIAVGSLRIGRDDHLVRAISNVEKNGQIGYASIKEQSLWQSLASLVYGKQRILPIHSVTVYGENLGARDIRSVLIASQATLRELDVEALSLGQNDTIIVGSMPKLETLSIKVSEHTPRLPIQIDAPNLKSLNVFNFGMFELKSVSSSGEFQYLNRLQIDGVVNAESLAELERFPYLQQLIFATGDPDVGRGGRLTGEGVVKFPKLPRVHLVQMPYVIDGSVRGFDLSNLTNLKELRFVLTTIPDKFLANSTLPIGLEEIVITRCVVSSEAFAMLGPLPNLKKLTLELSSTDNGIFGLIRNFPSLVELSLGASEVSGGAIEEIAAAKKLKYIRFSGAMDSRELERLPILHELEILDIRFIPVTELMIDSILLQPRLKTLYVSKSEISESALKRISTQARIDVRF